MTFSTMLSLIYFRMISASLTPTIRHWTDVHSGNPELIAVQLVPLSLDIKTPPPRVDAKRFGPQTTRSVIMPHPGPPDGTHWAPAHRADESKIPRPTRKMAIHFLICDSPCFSLIWV